MTQPAPPRNGTRIEHDSLGDVEGSTTALWGVQTQRSLSQFGLGRGLVRFEMDDATPLAPGEKWSDFDGTLLRISERIANAKRDLYRLVLGGTVIHIDPNAALGFADIAALEPALPPYKIGNEMRLLLSGPRAGMHTLLIPETEPVSSIEPSKVDPIPIEALTRRGLSALRSVSTGRGDEMIDVAHSNLFR